MMLGSKVKSLLFIIILLISLIPITNLRTSTADLINPSVLTTHSSISIYGNSQFTSSNGVVSGNGTKNDPYIIENWSINASSNRGIYIVNTNANFIIRNCHIFDGTSGTGHWDGISFINVTNGKIENNRLNNNVDDICLYTSGFIIIKNNSCSRIELGYSDFNIITNNSNSFIGLGYSDFNIITNNSNSFVGLAHSDFNIINNNSCLKNGILIYYSNHNIITNNNYTLGHSDIGLSNSDNNTISNNTCLNNDGIDLHDSNNNIIINNTIINNNYFSIRFKSSNNNTIYNNYFISEYNYDVDSNCKGNIWNTSKTIGRNIIGGPYLGGNFWSDYAGVDIDEDGFGDTNLPYGPGDQYPLMPWADLKPPQITDQTNGSPTTGDPFGFNATVFDVGDVKSVHINYWCNQNEPVNETMNQTSGNKILGDYFFNTTVLDSALKLYYSFHESDITGHWNSTIIYSLDVIDNDKPGLEDLTRSIPVNGDNFSFNASAWDNINVSDVYVEYWFNENNNSRQNTTFTLQESLYNTIVTIPLDAINMSYILSAVDNSSNWVNLDIEKLNISDNDKPIISDLSGIPTTGDKFEFSFEIIDNFDVSIAYFIYWFDDGIQSNITLSNKKRNFATVPNNALKLHIIVTAIDSSNNIGQLKIVKPVIDNDAPVIDIPDLKNPETGRSFYFNCSVTDNREIDDVLIEYWFDETGHKTAPMILNDENYSIAIEVPNNANKLYYNLTANDTSNNMAQKINSIYVIDVLPPEIFDQTVDVPTTGDAFEFKGYAEDNIGVEVVYLEYWYDHYNHNQITFAGSLKITIPSSIRSLYYKITAIDVNSNFGSIEKNLIVIDNDKPVITDYSYQSGNNFTFLIDVKDNIKVLKVNVELRYDNGTGENITIIFINDNYEKTIPIFLSSGDFYYTIFAMDTSDNWDKTYEKKIELESSKVEQPKEELVLEPSSPSKSSEDQIFWIVFVIIIILIFIILTLIVLHSFYRKKRRQTKDSPGMVSVNEKNPISPAPIPEPSPKLTQPVTKSAIQSNVAKPLAPSPVTSKVSVPVPVSLLATPDKDSATPHTQNRSPHSQEEEVIKAETKH